MSEVGFKNLNAKYVLFLTGKQRGTSTSPCARQPRSQL